MTQIQSRIETLDAGKRRIIDYLMKHGIRIKNIIEINRSSRGNARYIILQTTRGNFLFGFKRDFFHNFGTKFIGKREVGDSFNVKDLQIAIRDGVNRIYSIFPNGKLYTISMTDFLLYSHRWTQKEGTVVRSISIHKFSEVNDGS